MLGLAFQNLHKLWWLHGALAVSLSISLMCLTGSLNPPSGALALLYVVSRDVQHWCFLFIPVSMAGSALLIMVSIVVNNIPKYNKYPGYWRIIYNFVFYIPNIVNNYHWG